ncbi:AAA family ATPase [Streptomyces sp. NPDC002758]
MTSDPESFLGLFHAKLAESGLAPQVRELLLDTIGTATAAGGPAPRAYLQSVTVGGFRGIGRTARLALTPGPGLTLVTGRNGSGKSSFAEAIEIALTGDNARWRGRSDIWRKSWRNLHHGADPAGLVKSSPQVGAVEHSRLGPCPRDHLDPLQGGPQAAVCFRGAAASRHRQGRRVARTPA